MPHKDPEARREYMRQYKLKHPKFWKKYAPSVIRVPKPCELCGKVFQPNIRGVPQRWCSPRCRVRSWDNTEHGKRVKREWLQKDPARNLAYNRKHHYGITRSEYEEWYERLGGRCEICRRHFDLLHIDHNHLLEKKNVRGLLCAQCNKGLGLFEDDPERFVNAAKYLRRSIRK